MKTQPLEPLSRFTEEEAVDKIIEYMTIIYLKRADPILKIPGWKQECRRKIKKFLPRVEDARNTLIQNIAAAMSGEIIGEEPEGKFAWGWQDKYGQYQVRKTEAGKEVMVVDSFKVGGWK